MLCPESTSPSRGTSFKKGMSTVGSTRLFRPVDMLFSPQTR